MSLTQKRRDRELSDLCALATAIRGGAVHLVSSKSDLKKTAFTPGEASIGALIRKLLKVQLQGAEADARSDSADHARLFALDQPVATIDLDKLFSKEQDGSGTSTSETQRILLDKTASSSAKSATCTSTTHIAHLVEVVLRPELYEQSTFFADIPLGLRLFLPPGYPQQPPYAFFVETSCAATSATASGTTGLLTSGATTKIPFHPNISPSSGDVCMDLLRVSARWSPVMTLSTTVHAVISLLDDPNDAHGLNGEALLLFSILMGGPRRSLSPTSQVDDDTLPEEHKKFGELWSHYGLERELGTFSWHRCAAEKISDWGPLLYRALIRYKTMKEGAPETIFKVIGCKGVVRRDEEGYFVEIREQQLPAVANHDAGAAPSSSSSSSGSLSSSTSSILRNRNQNQEQLNPNTLRGQRPNHLQARQQLGNSLLRRPDQNSWRRWWVINVKRPLDMYVPPPLRWVASFLLFLVLYQKIEASLSTMSWADEGESTRDSASRNVRKRKTGMHSSAALLKGVGNEHNWMATLMR
ncbi:unnamed protein product [Amoebophrya sp. A25]|nr:unnamed protein product [Amoebophrya sp. A25]|eukprot:GSA25T00007190001.1